VNKGNKGKCLRRVKKKGKGEIEILECARARVCVSKV